MFKIKTMVQLIKDRKLVLAFVYLITAILLIIICLIRKDRSGLDPFLWSGLFPIVGLGFDVYYAIVRSRILLNKPPLIAVFSKGLFKALIGLTMLILLMLPVDILSKSIVTTLGVRAPQATVRLDKLEKVDESTTLDALKIPTERTPLPPFTETTYYRSYLIIMMLVWGSLFFVLDWITENSKRRKTD